MDVESEVPTAAELHDNFAAGAIERVLAAQIDLAARRVGIHAGRERVVELDRLDAGDGHLFEGVLTAGVVVRTSRWPCGHRRW